MKSLLNLAFVLFLSTGLFAQATTITDNNARVRNVGSFQGVKVSSGIELLIQQGDQEAVAVSSSKPEYTDRIKTVVENGVLKISIDDKSLSSSWRRNVKFKAYVSVRQLNLLGASSGAIVKTGSSIKIDGLKLDASSGAIVEAEFDGGQIASESSSGAITTLKGKVEQLDVEASSGAAFKGYGLSTKYCSAEASSGGIVNIHVAGELNASASSGGAIHYKGGGVIRNLRTGSGGTVKSKS